MFDVEVPAGAATEDEAPLTECALKIDVSLSESPSKGLSHLATVLEDTALCATSSLVSLPRRDFVLTSYSFKVDTGHNLFPPGREGKKKLVICDMDRDCLAKALG